VVGRLDRRISRSSMSTHPLARMPRSEWQTLEE
jgi:hypothetical protein